MAVITKGIELYWVSHPSGDIGFTSQNKVEGKGYLLAGLQEIGDLVGTQGAERDKIEITTLADDKHVYTDGLIAEAENDGIEFKFLFDKDLYKGFVDTAASEANTSQPSTWALYIPTGVTGDSGAATATYSSFDIVANCAVKVDGAGVNSAMTMTVTLTPTEVIEFNK